MFKFIKILSLVFPLFFTACGTCPKENAKCNLSDAELSVIEKGDIDFSKMLKPAPLSSKFINDNFYIWCGTAVKGDDGNYNLYYSRWPRANKHGDWVRGSEITHAVSKSIFGPWQFKDVALPPRSANFWDSTTTHNPTVMRFDNKYYLYYTGNTGDNQVMGFNWIHRNNQRIGVAVADNPNGPWKRFDKPVIDIGSDPDAHDAKCIANPSVTKMNNGKYLMVYKAIAGRNKPPAYGPVVHLTAVADKPEGPFIKQNKPIFTSTINPNMPFPAEDPYIWNQNGTYYAIVKDMRGAFTSHGQALVLFYSHDGFDWQLAKNPLVSTLQIKWADGKVEKVAHLERPQLVFEEGLPIALICAADYDRGHSFNLVIPVDFKAGLQK